MAERKPRKVYVTLTIEETRAALLALETTFLADSHDEAGLSASAKVRAAFDLAHNYRAGLRGMVDGY